MFKMKAKYLWWEWEKSQRINIYSLITEHNRECHNLCIACKYMIVCQMNSIDAWMWKKNAFDWLMKNFD
jgi:hypothetical protein